MPMTNYPRGLADGVSVRNMPVLNCYSNDAYWVDSAKGSDGNDGSFLYPFGTINHAIHMCTPNKGDIIMVKAGHAETLATADAIKMDVAGVSVVGLGTGASRPVISITPTSSLTTPKFVNWTAANCSMQNIVFSPTVLIAAMTTWPVYISAANVNLDATWQEANGATNTATGFYFDGVQNAQVYIDFPGAATTSVSVPVRIANCANMQVEVDYYGVVINAVVWLVTLPSYNINIEGTFYVTNDVSGTHFVGDFAGSTWYARVVAAPLGGVVIATNVAPTFILESNGPPVPAPGSFNNATVADVVGNKSDQQVAAPYSNASLVSLSQSVLANQFFLPRSNFTGTVNVSGKFTVAASPISIFNVYGVIAARIVGCVGTVPLNGAGVATMSVGTADNPASMLPVTTVNGTNFQAYQAWTPGATTTQNSIALPANEGWTLVASAMNYQGTAVFNTDIVLTVGTTNVTGGDFLFVLQWIPLSTSAVVLSVIL